MIHMHDFPRAISILWCRLLQFPHPGIMLRGGTRSLSFERLFLPIPFRDAIQKGSVARNSKPSLFGFTFEQQVDGCFRLLFQRFVMRSQVLFKQLISLLTQARQMVSLAILSRNEANEAMSVNGLRCAKRASPSLQGSCRDDCLFW